MTIDIIFAISFVISVYLLWYRISIKIPQLIAIPDQVITERFHEDSAWLRLFILHIKLYYKEGKYKQVFWNFLGKTLYKLHLLLLRIDNNIVVFLKIIRIKSFSLQEQTDENHYPQKFQEPHNNSAAKNIKIEGVRKRDII